MDIWQRKVLLLEEKIIGKLESPVKNYDVSADLPNLVNEVLNMQLNQLLDLIRVNPALGNLPNNLSKMNTIYDIIQHNAFIALIKAGEKIISEKS